MTRRIKRRTFVKTAAAAAASSLLVPRFALGAQPINVGSLTPNTGGGGPFGPKITAAHKKVTDMVNEAGGILGREVALYQDNSETNPETAIRAAAMFVSAAPYHTTNSRRHGPPAPATPAARGGHGVTLSA